ncbi:hypothetical protein [Burkholderia pseudomallei]|uniref:Uncharacterized protein n=2 Tax=Burkholderia pseudomallei TaxID=28450 RepID=A0AAX0U4E0_BURPE|nr:hypothetical protein [Burkholderia pseudomallei]ABN93961.1 hypothetical protein BURPS1106A_A2714 [Burkholderia pseudomallei 1106a]EES23360.1 hypothetical protein BURPS1106B_2460 [Burkholderia pseudomallei 1106b]AUL58907.1 hypothetical protein BHT10_23735 [Burkholderia pseudomallei]MDV2081860.1 hypothetical protein [Burkholderia pseudomallei]MDV2118400.1 hypothetical protein [Burkholderia pseudomallei]
MTKMSCGLGDTRADVSLTMTDRRRRSSRSSRSGRCPPARVARTAAMPAGVRCGDLAIDVRQTADVARATK